VQNQLSSLAPQRAVDARRFRRFGILFVLNLAIWNDDWTGSYRSRVLDCLLWRGVIDASLVGEDCRDEFVAFAQLEGQLVAKTLDGKMPTEDSWMTAMPWEDMSYPGMPLKPRPAGTIKIEVNIPKRTITTVWEMLHRSMEFELPEEYMTGNDIEDVICEARHVMEALKIQSGQQDNGECRPATKSPISMLEVASVFVVFHECRDVHKAKSEHLLYRSS